MKNLFVTATERDVGKTAFTVGLLSLLREELGDVGYMKPIGQRYVVQDGMKVDEDVAVINSIFSYPDALEDMSPIVVDRDFTRKYLDLTGTDDLIERVMRGYHHISDRHGPVVMEGAGKCSVGECFGLSNMQAAKMTDSPVVLLAEGGIGSTVDACLLQMAYMKQYGVDVRGVIINKVYREKYDEIVEVTARGLERRGVPVLGVVPYEPVLSYPTLQIIMDELEVRRLTLKDQPDVDKNIGRIVVGAMKPHHALNYIRQGELLITGGDRGDILISVLCRSAMSLHDDTGFAVVGILVTGGMEPHQSILDVAERLGILVLATDQDTYNTVARIKGMRVKLRKGDDEKVEALVPLIREHIDLDRILG